MAFEWTLRPGDITTRTELAAFAGGDTQSGIAPATRSNSILIFSDPARGERHGYNFDGRSEDGRAFNYTGAGPSGPQVLTRGNLALFEHAQNGKAIHLFVADGHVEGSQTRRQVYVGEFRIDPAPNQAYQSALANGRDGLERTVFVFRLLPVGPDTKLSEVPFAKSRVPTTHALLVPLEVYAADSFVRPFLPAAQSSRQEASLTDSFVLWLSGHGKAAQRWSIPIPNSSVSLFSDVYIVADKHLFEAKASASRSDIRMAIGQLLDYRRHIDVDGLRCSILVPELPEPDLIDLIRSVGFGCVARIGELTFKTVL